VSVTSTFNRGELMELDDDVAIVRPANADWSYAECAHRGDFASRHTANPCRTSWLFGEQFMERGVIRRLRLRGALTTRAGDAAAALRLRAALAAEQPPLTA
jgi:hypothetical protein